VSAWFRTHPERRLDGRLRAGSVDGTLLYDQGVSVALFGNPRLRAQEQRCKRHGTVPRATATGFQATAGLDGVRLLSLGMMGAAEVAEYGYRATMQGRVIAVPGIQNRIGTQAGLLQPRSLMRALVCRIQAKPE